MKKTTLILFCTLIFSMGTTAQEILGHWQYNGSETIIDVNDDNTSNIIQRYLNKASNYNIIEFRDNGVYIVNGVNEGRYEIKNNKLIDLDLRFNKAKIADFGIQDSTLTFHIDFVELGFFNTQKLKDLDIENPKDVKINEAKISLHWIKIPDDYQYDEENDAIAPTIKFNPPTIAKDDSIEKDYDDEYKTEVEETYYPVYPQDIIGKWKIVKKKPEVIASNKDVSKIIIDEFNSFSDDYDTYIQFSNDGEYTEHLLDTEKRTETYKTNGNKIKISSSVDCIYSINKDTLDLIFDYTKHYTSGYKQNSESVNKVVLHTYLKRLPDHYDIDATMKEAMIRDSIILVSKHPEKVKDDIIGKWIQVKTETIVVSNNKEYDQRLKNMTQDLLSDYPYSNLVFDNDNMIENYVTIPYKIEGNMLETNKESMPFSINDSILTIDRDLRSALVWMGIGIGDHDRMLSIRKYAVRTHYQKVIKEVHAGLKKTDQEFSSFVNNNMQYPAEAIENKIEGEVVVVLRIEADGTVSYAGVSEEKDPLLDAEAVRIAKLMTPEWWEPAKENNISVPGYTAIQIVFRLPENK